MIRIDALCAGYGEKERLHALTAHIPRGKLTALIGPNGCGKSTLLRCAAGLIRPMSGTVSIGGVALSGMSDRERARRIAYMPQFRTVPEITARQLAACGRHPHLSWGRRLSQNDERIVSGALERAGAAEYAERLLTALSGGERQSAYLAMMLAQQAEVMLLDEPTTYLDLSAQFRLMRLLRELSGEGRTLLVVLHDLRLAMEYADRVLLMRQGRIVCGGAPGEVFASGALDAVFGVQVQRTGENRYVFSERES